MIKTRLGLHDTISPNQCIMFTGCKNHKGYGLIHYNGKLCHAHRVSYEVFFGKIPEKTYICHTCDNRACVNPNHLFAGSHAENMADMVKKGRSLKGEKSSSAVLTEASVIKIRSDNRSQRKIALEYGVSKTTISKIKNRETWTHI